MAIENITGNETLEELQALMEVVQKRLAILDEKKALTRPEIYSKVRGEYQAKIQEIESLMLERGADLEEALNQAVVDQDTLGLRKQELKDILDEMELRLVIGEIDEETKARQAQEHTEEMAEIDAKLAALEQKVSNFQKMLAAQPKKAAPAPPAYVPEPPKTAPAPRPAPQQARPFRPQPETSAPQPAAPIQPKPVLAQRPAPVPAPEPPKPAPRQAPAPAPEPPPVAAPEPAVNEIDELEKQFASLLGENLAGASQKAEPAKADEPVEIIATVAEGAESAEESHEGELKCPKCGSFNRADNWYCEKCGNELISAQDLLGK